MASSSFSLLFFYLATLIHASLQLAPSPAPAPSPQGSLIQHVCSHHTNPKFCFDQLHNDPEGRTADLFDLGRVGIRLATARANDTGHIKFLLATEEEPETSLFLRNCLDDYDEALASLDEAVVDLAQGDYSKLNLDASATSDSGTICEDRFGEADLKSPLTDDNKELTDLAQIVEIVANLLLAGGTGFRLL